MNERLLLCADLDRTLLPNGLQPESRPARPLFRRLAALPGVQTAYVSGRHRELIEEAIREYEIPVPDYVIGDVGTSLYTVLEDRWETWPDWSAHIAADWNQLSSAGIIELLRDLSIIELQESTKQSPYKVSFYLHDLQQSGYVLPEIHSILLDQQIKANVIWSIDETSHTGLIDIIPRSASKLHAIEYLCNQLGYGRHECLFAGDSGNDLSVVTSRIDSVLVANATQDVKKEAIRIAGMEDTMDSLYIAQGRFHDMNGNYAAGILEGVVHYHPQAEHWIDWEIAS